MNDCSKRRTLRGVKDTFVDSSVLLFTARDGLVFLIRMIPLSSSSQLETRKAFDMLSIRRTPLYSSSRKAYRKRIRPKVVRKHGLKMHVKIAKRAKKKKSLRSMPHLLSTNPDI